MDFSNSSESPANGNASSDHAVHWLTVIGAAAVGALVVSGVGYVLGPYEGMSGKSDPKGPRGGGGPVRPGALRGPSTQTLSPSEQMQARMQLQQIEQQIQMLLQQGQLPRAIQLCETGIDFCEKAFGPDCIEMVNFSLLLSRIYEAQQNNDKAIQEYVRTGRILRREYEDKNPEVTAEDFAPMADKIRNKLLATDRYEECVEWAELSVQVREEMLAAAPSRKEGKLNLATAVRYHGVCLSRLGRFRECFEVMRKGIEILKLADPLSNEASASLEALTSSLHQNGKTDESIAETDKYAEFIVDLPGSSNFLAELWGRAGFLLITLSDWEAAKSYYEKAYDILESSGLPPTLEIMSCLSTVYWEMNNSEKAKEMEEKIRQRKVTFQQLRDIPQTRSDVLTTLTAHIHDGRYRLDLRINRTRPLRQEGDALEDPDSIKRKFETCFVKVEFENPAPSKKLTESASFPKITIPSIEDIDDMIEEDTVDSEEGPKVEEVSEEGEGPETVAENPEPTEEQPETTEEAKGTEPEGDQGPSIIEITQDVQNYQFTVDSPIINAPKPGTWLKAVVHVYKDYTMSEKLGTHHQLVYNIQEHFGMSGAPSYIYR